MSEKTDIDEIISRGIDLKNRRIHFGLMEEDGSDISWHSVEAAVRAMLKMSTEYPKKPIELHLSSTGGATYEVLRFYDAIQACPCQIKFFGSGQIMSAAVVIMVGCDERWLTPNATIMNHNGSADGIDHTITDREIDTEELKRLTDRTNMILADNSRFPLDFWSGIGQRDLYLTATEAVMLGIADGILEPKKRGNLRKVRSHALAKVPDNKELTKLVKNLYKRTHKGGTLTKIEIHIPKEEFDNSLTIDTSPVPEEVEINNITSNEEKETTVVKELSDVKTVYPMQPTDPSKKT